ncbi:MAG: hypothetical protein ACI8V2_002813, partial [Candidatus Latescibacterota bacterium]
MRKGRMAYAEGWELRGQVRVVSARKNTEAYEKPLAASERPSLLLSCVFTRKMAPQAKQLKINIQTFHHHKPRKK